MQLTGAEIIVECLKEQGVDTVFGYPGGAILNVYDALYEYKDQITHVLTSHEQGASHAADGYARSTGKVGVCLATSGPGATNLVTGIATAYMDSVPMVAITSNVTNNLIGRDAFQEVYITGITMPITKHNFFVNRIEDLANALRQAFRIAQSGRKGPVLVDVTKDVTAALVDYVPERPLPLKEMPKATDEELQEVADAINKAECPVIYCGGGAAARQVEKELHALMETSDIPAAHTMMAAGLVPYDDERALGMIGMHGSVTANEALFHADLVLALGTRFSDRVALNIEKFSPEAVKIQVDIDHCEVNKNVPVDQYIVGDVKDFMERLLPLLEKREHPAWRGKIAEWQKEQEKVAYRGEGLHPGRLIRDVCDMVDKDTIFVTDVGQHQMWAAQYYKYSKPRTLLTSGGLGTMGYGLGAAIGAQTANPDRTVVNIAGDGCFRMNMNELATASREKLPLIEVIINNHVLGMVRQWQTLFYEKHYSATVLDDGVDYVKLSEAMGATARRVKTQEEFEKAFADALKSKTPFVIDCIIDSDDKVWPMVAPGKPINESFDEEDYNATQGGN